MTRLLRFVSYEMVRKDRVADPWQAFPVKPNVCQHSQGATTLSKTTLSIMTFSIMAKCGYAKFQYAECSK
jgi:hypothetical protein